MFQHNLIIAFRNFSRFKGTFFINLIGLSTGIACSLLIYLWVNDELHMDKFHDQEHQPLLVLENNATSKSVSTTLGTAHFLGETLKADFPEVEYTVVTTPPLFFPSFSLASNGNHVKGTGKFASNDFFNVFTFELLAGDKHKVLAEKNNVVISQQLAIRLFGSEKDCIGKTLEYKLFDITKLTTVSGIFKDISNASSERFDFVVPFDSFKDIMGMNGAGMNWDAPSPFNNYLTLSKEVDQKNFDNKIAGYLKSKSQSASGRTLFTQPYSDTYLHGNYENGVQTGGRFVYVRLFSLIAILILVIACINFINLSTARAMLRAKEVAIKKTVGAKRGSLILQYLSESLLITFLSWLVAILLADLSLSGFNTITGKNIELKPDLNMLLLMTATMLGTGLLAGSYPALYLSKFKPVKILKGKINTISFGELWSRKSLVVVQFTLSVLFIICVIIISKQMQFIQEKDLGYSKDNVLYFEAEGKVVQSTEAFLTGIKSLPGVVSASSMLGNIVGESGGIPGTTDVQGKKIVIHSSAINYDLIETLGIELKEGRTFSKELDRDTMKVIYNEAAIEALGITDPIGKRNPGGYEIVGVVKNFHFQSLHKEVEPFCFRLEPHYAVTILIRIKPGSTAETMEPLKTFYKDFNPGYALDYQFLDQQYHAQYVAEQRVADLSRYFTGLAILISCLGLFALATFTSERRQKEIGIRKVLGASQFGIIRLLSGEFTLIILTAIAIALPIGYLLSKRWLENFAYHIELHWTYFIAAGAVALAIAWLTIGIQTIRASRIDPVRYLKED